MTQAKIEEETRRFFEKGVIEIDRVIEWAKHMHQEGYMTGKEIMCDHFIVIADRCKRITPENGKEHWA